MKRIDRGGYVRLSNGRFEHRVAMEQHLGRPLLRSEHVHHKNRDRADNRIENLQIIAQADHNRLHGDLRRTIGKTTKRPESPTAPRIRKRKLRGYNWGYAFTNACADNAKGRSAPPQNRTENLVIKSNYYRRGRHGPPLTYNDLPLVEVDAHTPENARTSHQNGHY